jgi:hypothetical protein
MAGEGPEMDRCLLCDSKRPEFFGIFIPKNQVAVGAPTGKVRAVAYQLCGKCHGLPDWMERLDEMLMNDLKVAAAARSN